MPVQPYRKSNRNRPKGQSLRAMKRGRARYGPDRASINRLGLKKKKRRIRKAKKRTLTYGPRRTYS